MWIEIITAFGLIFLAELGDKSQILAMMLATKYKTRTVIVGVFLGILVNHVLAILLGSTMATILTPLWTSIIVGIIFLAFGFLSILETPHKTTLQSYTLPPVLSVAILFFISELGDKTQFATMALSLESTHPWLLLVGTVSAMMTTSVLAIWVGKQIGQKVPEFTLKVISTTVFIGYGTLRIGLLILPYSFWYLVLLLVIVVPLYLLLVIRYKTLSTNTLSALQEVAEELHQYYEQMMTQFDVICLGESVCGVCEQEGCLLGHVKYLLEEGKQGHPVSMSHLRSKTVKDVDPSKVEQSLKLTIHELKEHWDDSNYQTLHLIRQNLEFILYQKTLRSPSYEQYVNDRTLLLQKGTSK